MPPFIAFLAAAAASTAIYGLFFSGSKDDDNSNSDSASPPRTTSTTSPSYSSSPRDSHSRGQTNTRTPATSASHHDLYHSSHSPTYTGDSHRAPSTSTQALPSYPQPSRSTHADEDAADFWTVMARINADLANRDNNRRAYRSDPASRYNVESRETLGTSAHTDGSQPLQTRIGQTKDSTTTSAGYGASVHRTSVASHHVGRSSQTPSASTREHASYHQPPTNSRVAEATTRTQTRHLTSDYDGYGYRPSVASSNTGESRETSTSTRAHVPRPPQVTSTRASWSTVSTTATADYPHGSRRPRPAAPYPAESTLTGPASSPTRASYQRTSSPDATRFGYPDFPPTHSRTLSSSSGSDYLGASPSPRVALRSPSPQPDALYGTEFEVAENVQDMKAARELRERARRCKNEMHNARDLAKSARRSGDHNTQQMYRQDAIALESEMKSLDKRAAKIIFREKNKVCGNLSRSGCYAQPRHARQIRRERSTSTAFMSWKLSSTQRKSSNLPRIETTTRSILSLVRLSTRS